MRAAYASLVRRLVDPLLIAVITACAWLLGQPFAGFNSPDSEFYASLALFGSDVADRSLDAAYTWTRLGYIAPVRALTEMFGTWAGFGIWRLLLIAVVVGSTYGVVRLVSTRQLAVVISGLTALSTVVLSFVGNTYLTGTVIAGVFALVSLACWQALGTPRRAWVPGLLAGLASGWLAMTNPYGMLLGLSMWLGVRVVTAAKPTDRRWLGLARDGLLGIAGFAVSFGALLLTGLTIFPGRNWFATYIDWNARLDYTTFIGDASAWQHDLALLVPLAAIALPLIALLYVRAGRPAVVALVIGLANLAFTALYYLVVPGPWLEAPTYVALLWPGSLLAIALAFAAIVGSRDLGRAGWAGGALLAVLAVWAGHWSSDLPLAAGLAILAVIIASYASAAHFTRGSQRVLGGLAVTLVIVSIGTCFTGSQLLQNGRGYVGTYGQFPFRAAYVDFEGELLMSSKIAAEEFVLAHTTPQDRIGIWTDPDRLMASVAAMQLWGWYNNVSSGAVLAPSESEALKASHPSVIAMYAPERAQVEAFYASLPKWSAPTDLECTTVEFRGVGNESPTICLTHLRWP